MEIMVYRSIVLYFYLAITIIAFISPSKTSIGEYLPGMFLMWLFFLVFYFGVGKGVRDSDELNCRYLNKYLMVAVALIYPLFYNQYVKFYTDLSLVSAVSNLFAGVSNYYIYQTFFNESELNVFSVSKLPYILGHGIFKFFLFYYAIVIIAYKKERTYLELGCLAIMTVVVILVAVSRGTSFEFFELFFMFLYVYILRNDLLRKPYLISKGALLKVSVIMIVLVTFFMINIKTRMGENFDFSEIPDFNRNSYFYKLFPSLSLLIFSLNDYFLFGLQYTSSIYINLLKSFDGAISIFIPKGISIFGIDDNYRDFAQRHLDLGAKWNPDMSIYLDNYGLIGSLLIVFTIGSLTKMIFRYRLKNVFSSMIVFYAIFFMISFPVGNFISNSSSTILALFLSIGLYSIKTLRA